MSKNNLAQQPPKRNPSAYALVISVAAEVEIAVGKSGRHTFKAGTYIYAGNARRAFDARIKRHLSRKKRNHWHIDYLLGSRCATVKEVWAFADGSTECDIIAQLMKHGAAAPVKGFGAGDCRNGCAAHLVRVRGVKGSSE